MNRRGFLYGALGLLAAPAIVRASSLMPVSARQLFNSGEISPLLAVRREFDAGRFWVMTGSGLLSFDAESLHELANWGGANSFTRNHSLTAGPP